MLTPLSREGGITATKLKRLISERKGSWASKAQMLLSHIARKAGISYSVYPTATKATTMQSRESPFFLT